MSFREFKDELLLALVLEAEASTTKQLVPQTVASKRGLNFREGWLRQAVKSLDDSGLVRASFFIGGGPEGGMSLTITGDGLEQAEELASNSGFDLYEEIDNHDSVAKSRSEKAQVPASDRVVRIDHNSQEIREINGKLDQVIESVVESNSLSVDADEKAQRVAELEAGKRLLEAPQAERGLLERLFVPVLKWIAEKSAEQVIATLVITLLTLIAAYFGFSL